jgi:hypothetical protein
MGIELQVTTDTSEGLEELFALTDEEEALQREGISFRATTRQSPAFGAGMPEIADLIVALGSAGVFTALTTILGNYFRGRPSGKIIFRRKKGSGSITFTAENCDAAEVARSLKGMLT